MSDIKQLPEHTFTTDLVVTYHAPHILRGATTEGGRESFTISKGGRKQVALSVESWLSETPVEPPEIFKILATNNITIDSAVGIPPINVLNDAMEYDGKMLAPSNPTASQYLALVGKKVIMSPSLSTPAFSCTLLKPENPLLRQYERAKLYSVKQVSIVLP